MGSPESRLTREQKNVQRVVRNAIFEIIPLKSAATAIEALPADSKVSVTASAAKGLDATLELAEQVIQQGHQTIPHLSARLVKDRSHVRDLASWLKDHGVTTAFVIGGDATDPGEYPDAHSFLRDLFEHDHGLGTVGLASYPDGHPLIGEDDRRTALYAKQDLLAEAGIKGYCSTQMCFDPEKIISWLKNERLSGLTLPVHLGVAGAVERATLLTVGARLGIGQSLRYLRKNRRSVARLLSSSTHDPYKLLDPMGNQLTTLGITGLHMFTFNQVEATAVWRDKVLNA